MSHRSINRTWIFSCYVQYAVHALVKSEIVCNESLENNSWQQRRADVKNHHSKNHKRFHKRHRVIVCSLAFRLRPRHSSSKNWTCALSSRHAAADSLVLPPGDAISSISSCRCQLVHTNSKPTACIRSVCIHWKRLPAKACKCVFVCRSLTELCSLKYQAAFDLDFKVSRWTSSIINRPWPSYVEPLTEAAQIQTSLFVHIVMSTGCKVVQSMRIYCFIKLYLMNLVLSSLTFCFFYLYKIFISMFRGSKDERHSECISITTFVWGPYKAWNRLYWNTAHDWRIISID